MTPGRSRAALAGWLVCAIVVASIVVSLVLRPKIDIACTAEWEPPTPTAATSCERLAEEGGKPAGVGVVMGGVGLVFAVLGTVVVSRRPDNAIPWIFLWIAIYLAIQGVSEQYAFHGLVGDPGSFPGARSVGWLAQMGGGVVFFTPLIFFFLLFPTGRLPSRRWRPFAYVSVATMFLAAFFDGFSAVPLRAAPGYTNPFGLEVVERIRTAAEVPLLFAILFALAGAVASLVVRFRRSRGDERQQLKWFTAAATLLGTAILIAPLLWTRVIPAPEWVWPLMLSIGLIALPISAAVAILRYRLYDIDVVINRTLVYGALTAILAALYVALVFGFQALLAPFTAESDLAVAGSTLAVAALFRPMRGRLQSFIDRRFYRRKVNAEETLETFGARVRDEVELRALSDQLLGVVGETWQPTHVSLWLRSERASS